MSSHTIFYYKSYYSEGNKCYREELKKTGNSGITINFFEDSDHVVIEDKNEYANFVPRNRYEHLLRAAMKNS